MNATVSSLPDSLVFSHDGDPGYTRRRAGKGFAYYDDRGSLLRSDEIRDRLRKLAIPPAYSDVWFCRNPRGHLQATGIDDRGRKQYRYHADWSEWRSRQKFDGLLDFSKVLPAIRRAVRSQMDSSDLTKHSVVAAVVKLLDKTALRIGNDTYQKQNGTAGLTTLRHRHVTTEDGFLQLNFRAKGGEKREFDLYLPSLAAVVEKLEDLPGQRLFQYYEEGGDALHPVTSSDVNEWLKEVSGLDISAKDFRTWRASHLTLDHLLRSEPSEGARERVSQENEALKATSKELGHRPPVCRKHYVHPMILQHHRDGTLRTMVKPSISKKGLSASENQLVAFLRRLRKAKAAE